MRGPAPYRAEAPVSRETAPHPPGGNVVPTPLRWPLALAVSLVTALIMGPLPAAAEESAPHGHRSTDHAPIGVMGDHVHRSGEWMLSYRAMRMSMNGNRTGSTRTSLGEVHARFPVAPVDMDMEMHMAGVMWAPDDRVTLMAMVPYGRIDMKHVTRMGRRFVTRANGIGDISVGALVPVLEREHAAVHVNLGVSLPTGSISERDDLPTGTARLPYPMQLGSGTFDLKAGATSSGERGHLSYGAQLLATLRTGTNDKGYRLGNRGEASAWLAWAWSPSISTSLRLAYSEWGRIHGDDDALAPAVVPTADPALQGGRRVDAFLGLNYVVRGGALDGHRFALEVGRPLHQRLDGPRLETDWVATVGWQLAFD